MSSVIMSLESFLGEDFDRSRLGLERDEDYILFLKARLILKTFMLGPTCNRGKALVKARNNLAQIRENNAIMVFSEAFSNAEPEN